MKNIESKIKTLLNLFNANNYDLVILKSKRLIKEFPEYVILYNFLGSAYQNVGKFNQAENIFIKGIKMDPGNITIMNNLANVYKNNGKVKLSEELFEKIIKKKPDYVNAYVNYGNLKRDSNDFELAISLYNQALKINDKLPVIYYSLALAYQGLGKFDLAIEYAEKTLLIEPKFTQADMLISQSTKYNFKNKHFKSMEHKIKNLELNDNQKINLLFALAKANEDLNKISTSFDHLYLGNKIKRRSLNYNINEEILFFEDLKKIFNNFDFSKNSKDDILYKNLVFILGMPRSGTSLVEQIISSHSNVFGAGELPQLSKIVNQELMTNNVLSKEKIYELFNNESFANQLRSEYYEYVKRFNNSEAFITDKAPLNFRWIGLIRLLFPESKIIHCSINPKDNCLSLYKNFFEGGLNFSYDQNELVSYYKQYSSLMDFWNNLIPNKIFEAKYEEIIKNPEKEIKQIIDFCDLPWEDGCLSFHKNKNPIKTMSTAQARQPIYKSSMNSFEKFSPYLKEFNKIF